MKPFEWGFIRESSDVALYGSFSLLLSEETASFEPAGSLLCFLHRSGVSTGLDEEVMHPILNSNRNHRLHVCHGGTRICSDEQGTTIYVPAWSPQRLVNGPQLSTDTKPRYIGFKVLNMFLNIF